MFFSFLIVLIPDITSEAISKSFKTELLTVFIEGYLEIIKALIISRYPSINTVNNSVLNDFEIASEVISGIRTIRKEKNISFKEPIKLFVINNIEACFNIIDHK